jgi:hypothetical protein
MGSIPPARRTQIGTRGNSNMGLQFNFGTSFPTKAQSETRESVGLGCLAKIPVLLGIYVSHSSHLGSSNTRWAS